MARITTAKQDRDVVVGFANFDDETLVQDDDKDNANEDFLG